LIDHAQRRQALRHGAGQERVNIDAVELAASSADDTQMPAVHEALEHLAVKDARKAELVKLRYFAGLTNEEAALALGVSVPTVKRAWADARAWLFAAIKRGTSLSPGEFRMHQ
jgi:RNA polymerase sigma factor (TIGR02999 family)